MTQARIACDILYLSPHLDDAAFSCGGRIFDQAQAGKSVSILTLCTAASANESSDLARDLHQRWGLDGESVMTERRREDEAACQVLGAEAIHWSILDALYRFDPETDQALYPTLQSLFATPNSADAKLEESLAEKLSELVQAEIIHAPLAAGHHIDHQLVRRAAEAAFGKAKLLYYEDFPYARSARVLQRALGRRRNWTASAWPIGRKTFAAKIESIRCFASQLGTAFRDDADLQRQLKRFTQRSGGERSWRWVGGRGSASPPRSV